MKPSRVYAIAVAMLLLSSPASAAETWVDQLLRVTGLGAAPAQLRGSSDDVVSGDLWRVGTEGGLAQPLTSDGHYRSPVFAPEGGDLFVLRDETLMKLPAAGGRPVPLFALAGVRKLIGFQSGRADALWVLLDSGSAPLGVVSLGDGRLTPLELDPTIAGATEMLAQVRGQDRTFGPVQILVIAQSRRQSSRTVEWTEVYLQRDRQPPTKLSACNGLRCGEPALAPDGQHVVYVKQDPATPPPR